MEKGSKLPLLGSPHHAEVAEPISVPVLTQWQGKPLPSIAGNRGGGASQKISIHQCLVTSQIGAQPTIFPTCQGSFQGHVADWKREWQGRRQVGVTVSGLQALLIPLMGTGPVSAMKALWMLTSGCGVIRKL